jgi:hypothetical protein
VPAGTEGCTEAAAYGWRAKQGIANPFYEIRARDDRGPVPWDGQTPGEIEFVDVIPKTSTGKFLKSALRQEYRDRLPVTPAVRRI